MNILLVSPFYSQHFDAGWFWLRALQQLGHSVTLWDYRMDKEPPPLAHWREVTLVLKGEGLDPRKLPRPAFCYWPDAVERTPGIEDVLKYYDKVFTPIRPTPSYMEWLPTGWDPAIHHYTGTERSIESLYIGTNNSERKRGFVNVLRPRIIAGNNWAGQWVERIDRIKVSDKREPSITWVETSCFMLPQYLHDFVVLASRARVAINVHQGGVGLNRKLFELIPCAFTITDRVPGVVEILGRELVSKVSAETPGELKDMVEYFLKNEEERQELWIEEKRMIEPYTYRNAALRVLSCLS